MFNRETLFIVGAGASKEADLPCGDDLALMISGKLDFKVEEGRFSGGGDQNLYQLFRDRFRGAINSYLRAAWRIRDGIHLSDSIDNFLDLHRNNEEMKLLAKATIAKCILEAERNSKLYFDDSNANNTIKFRDLHATWFVKFMKVLAKNVPGENVTEIFQNVKFIAFNYDRCVEHFLYHALRGLYELTHETAVSICEEVEIDHPYGRVAPLRIQSGGGVRFGEDQANHIDLAANIRTFTEQTLDGDMLTSMRTKIEWAKCIIFLGCAFHQPNMIMLKPEKDLTIGPFVYSTGFGFSDDDATNIRAILSDHFRPRVLELRNGLKCAGLFDNFSRTIAG